MISKQDLVDYEIELKKLKYNLKKVEDDIRKEKSKELSDSVSGSNPNFPYEERHFVVTGVSELKLTKLRKKKRNAERRIEKLNKKLQYSLYHEDTLVAEIIEKRYIQRLEWGKIAMDLGYADESGVRKVFNRYFEKKQTCPFMSDIKGV